MGMRGVIAHRRTDGTVTLTTNQWCTRPEQELTLGLDIMESTLGITRKKAAQRLFDALSEVVHVSSIECIYNSTVSNSQYFDNFVKMASDDTTTFGFRAFWDDDMETDHADTSEDLAEIVQNHHHAEDGWSIYFDDANPDEIVLWIDPKYLVDDAQNRRVIPLT